jgi:hypothetical protein
MITLLTSPKDYTTVNNPVVWTWESDNTTQPNFSYWVSLYVNGSLHSNHEVFVARFDAQEALECIVKSELNYSGSVVDVFTDSIVKFRIVISERYGTPPIIQGASTVVTDEKVAINGALREKQWRDFLPEMYVLQNDTLSVQRKFLSTQVGKRYVGINESAHLALNVRLITNPVIFVSVWLYDATNTLVNSAVMGLTQFESIIINCSPRVIIANSPITLQDFEDSAYYDVRATLYSVFFPFVLNAVGRTEDERFYIDRDCTFYPWIRLHWLNKLGGYDAYSFKLDSVHETDIEILTSAKDRVHLHHVKSAIDKLILNTDWIDEQTQNWLVRELLESPQVYLEQGRIDLGSGCDCLRVVTVNQDGFTEYWRLDQFNITCDDSGEVSVWSAETNAKCCCYQLTWSGGTVTLNLVGQYQYAGEVESGEFEGAQISMFQTGGVWVITADEGEGALPIADVRVVGDCPPTEGWESSLEDFELSECSSEEGCDCIKITYQLVGGEPVTVEVEKEPTQIEGKNYYTLTIGGIDYLIRYSSDNVWILRGDFGNYFLLDSTSDCPFGVWEVDPTFEGEQIFESFEVEPCGSSCASEPIGTLQADCECPIGVFETGEGSPYTYFAIEPCVPETLNIEYEPIKVTNTSYRLRTRRRDGLMKEQVTCERSYRYRSQLL